MVSTSLHLSGWAHPLLCQFCAVLIEMQSTEGAYSFWLYFKVTLEKALTPGDRPLIDG